MPSVTHRLKCATLKVKALETPAALHTVGSRELVTQTGSRLLSQLKRSTHRIKMQPNSSEPSAYKKLFLIFPQGQRRGVCKSSGGGAGWRAAILFKRMNPYGPWSSAAVKQRGLYAPLPPILSEEEAQWCNVTSFHRYRMEATSPLLWFLSSSFFFINANSEMQYLNR